MADLASDLKARLVSTGQDFVSPFAAIGDQFLNRLNGPPRTRTRTDHTATLYIRSGRKSAAIGGVYEFAHRQGRPVRDIYACSPDGIGMPSDMIHGSLQTRQITLARFDLWTDIMEEVLGNSELITLCDQTGPLALRESWDGPSLVPGSGSRRIYEYRGCRIVDFARSISAIGDRVVRCSATLSWQTRLAL